MLRNELAELRPGDGEDTVAHRDPRRSVRFLPGAVRRFPEMYDLRYCSRCSSRPVLPAPSVVPVPLSEGLAHRARCHRLTVYRALPTRGPRYFVFISAITGKPVGKHHPRLDECVISQREEHGRWVSLRMRYVKVRSMGDALRTIASAAQGTGSDD